MNLDAIKERLAKATPGPWKTTDCGGCGEHQLADSKGDTEAIIHPHYVYEIVEASVVREEDADLIANAPTDLAECVKEIERLQEELASCERSLKSTQELLNEFEADHGEEFYKKHYPEARLKKQTWEVHNFAYMEHDARREPSATNRGCCNCGWKGLWVETTADASRDAQKHQKEENAR